MRIRNRSAAATAAPIPSPSPHAWERRTQEKGKEESEMGAPNSSALEPCRRNDGRRWRCKSAAAPGTSLCGHHLAQSLARKRRSSSVLSGAASARSEGASTNKKAQKSGATGARKAERRRYKDVYYCYYKGPEAGASARQSRAREAAIAEESDGGDAAREAGEDKMDGDDHESE